VHLRYNVHEGPYDRIILGYTLDKFCIAIFTDGSCIVQLVVMYGNSHPIFLVNVILVLMCVNDCNSISVRHEA